MADNERDTLLKALVACGDDFEAQQDIKAVGSGTFVFLHITPLTLICDLLARKLHEQGYRVTQCLENQKRSKKLNGKSRN